MHIATLLWPAFALPTTSAACALTAAVAASLLNNLWPFAWWAGLVFVILGDRAVYGRVLRRAQAGDPSTKLTAVIAWTVVQSAYGNILAVMLWFAPYVAGETLAASVAAVEKRLAALEKAPATPAERPFAERHAAFQADLRDYRANHLKLDQARVTELALLHGVPIPEMEDGEPRL